MLNTSLSMSNATAETNAPTVEGNKLVKRRAISTASQAQKINDSIIMADRQRDIRRAEVQRAKNGAAPFSSKKLREKNQAHRFNFSLGYLEGACGRAYSPYLDLGLDEEFVARINTDLDETKSNIVRAKFVEAVRRWGEWPTNYNGLVNETVDFGYSTAIFPDPYSPWWYFARQREGLTFDRAPNIVSKLDVFVWRRSYRIHELYDHVENSKAAEAAGWNVENVWVALENAAPDSYIKSPNFGNRQLYEEAIRAAALATSYGQGAKVIEVCHNFCLELSGKVSHWITLDSSSNPTDSRDIDRPDSQLFYQFEEFDSMDEVVTRFDFEFGDGYWHGSKGLGQKLYGIHRANDRMINSGLDQIFRSGLTPLKSQSQKGSEAAAITVTSDNVIYGPEIDAIPSAKLPPLDQSFFSMNAMLLATAVQRGGDVAPEAFGVDKPQKTATQSTIDAGMKQVITKSNLKRWVPSLSKVIDTMLKRLLRVEISAVDGQLSGHKDAVRFVQSLLDAGITEADLKMIRNAEVYHTIEDVFGETKQSVSYISDKYRGDPDISRLELKKLEVATWLGPAKSLELVPGDADQLEQLKASRKQSLEISTILDGIAVPVASDDLHTVEAQTGITYILDIAQRLSQGMTQGRRMPSMQDISNIAAHVDQHIQAVAVIKGQRDVARQLEAALKNAIATLEQSFQLYQSQHEQALLSGISAAVSEASSSPQVPSSGTSSTLPQPGTQPITPSSPETSNVPVISA